MAEFDHTWSDRVNSSGKGITELHHCIPIIFHWTVTFDTLNNSSNLAITIPDSNFVPAQIQPTSATRGVNCEIHGSTGCHGTRIEQP